MGILDALANTFGTGGQSNGTGGLASLPDGVESYQKMQGVLGTLDEIVKSAQTAQSGGSSAGRMSPLGLDAIIQDWVRQQFIYRRSILQDLYVLSYQVTEIRSVVLAIQREVFRRGFSSWEQKFVVKCPNCDKKSDDPDDTHCDECYAFESVTENVYDAKLERMVLKEVKRWKRDEEGKRIQVEMTIPDHSQQNAFDVLAKDVNSFHQNLIDVLQEFMMDVLIADDGFLLLNKEYEIDRETGEVAQQRIFEITRLHPALTEYDIDRKDGLPERSHWLCPIHREQQTHTSPGRCDVINQDGYICDGKLLPAMFRYYWRGRYRYYTAGEILHTSYFNPSKTYGYSPVLTVFEKILALVGADRTLYRYWYERRIPPGLLITYTDDPESLETEIERIKMQMLNDPNTFPWVAASARSNRGKTDFVKLAYTFQELDYLPVRQEIRERVAMLWGVTPLFTGDTRGVGGGLSGGKETAETSMHENLVESYQSVVNKNILPRLLDELGITDWNITLTPPREKNEADDLMIEKQRIDNALAMMQLGYEAVKTKGSELRFTYKKLPQVPGAQPGMPGGPPTMPGGMPGAEMPAMAGVEGGPPGMEGGLPPPPMSEGGMSLPTEEEPNV
ncbi:hypothetical protein CMI37_04050 [Candidatus Pacearchaeota archaeon]|nr:hypothetical protein [Candidatus Pacearchaeota archaeon]|tara:strand:- start:2134 stop:3987 length:1854 start_codon:yes stop_codon:yes gene_type:complete